MRAPHDDCELDDTLRAAGVRLTFAEMKDPVKDKLKRFGLFTRFGEENFFATLEEAVNAHTEGSSATSAPAPASCAMISAACASFERVAMARSCSPRTVVRAGSASTR